MPKHALTKRLLPSLVLVLVFAGVIALATRAPGIDPADPLGRGRITAQALPSIGYGIQTFLWWDESTRTRDLEFVRLMRFQYAKQIFGWRDIRPLKDGPESWTHADEVVAEASYRGVKLVARLGKPPTWAVRPEGAGDQPPFDEAAFGDFCGALASRYKGQIAAYQVWNEPNLDREWLDRAPNPSAYVKVLAACYNAIKANDPAAVVISAGLAPTGTHSPQVIPDDVFLKGMYEAGAARYYDVLGLNAPGYKSPPETPPDDPTLDGNRWQAFRHVEDMRRLMIAHGEGHKQVAILEMGWTTDTRETIPDGSGRTITNPYRWHAVTPAEQADYLVRAYRYAVDNWRPWMSLMTTIYIGDSTWNEANEEYWWSIVRPAPDGNGGNGVFMLDAFIWLANMERHSDATYLPPILDGVNPYTPMPPRGSAETETRP